MRPTSAVRIVNVLVAAGFPRSVSTKTGKSRGWASRTGEEWTPGFRVQIDGIWPTVTHNGEGAAEWLVTYQQALAQSGLQAVVRRERIYVGIPTPEEV